MEKVAIQLPLFAVLQRVGQCMDQCQLLWPEQATSNTSQAWVDDSLIKSLETKYSNFARLKADLFALHKWCKTPAQFLDFLYTDDFAVTIPEVTKYRSLILTLPATTASVERSSSVLKRLKTNNQNRMREEWLSSLALISVESEWLVSLQKNQEEFYNDIM